MARTTTVHLCRTVGESFPVVRTIRMTEAQLATLGDYDTLADAAVAIAAADIRLRVGVEPAVVEVVAEVEAVVAEDVLQVTVRLVPPDELFDVAQEHDQYLMFEDARRIWQGRWTVNAAPEVV